MKNIDKYKEVLFDVLAKNIGVGIGDNNIYFCREIYCEDCKLKTVCDTGDLKKTLFTTHKWIDENFESQYEDIIDYLCDDFAIRIPENEFTCCDEMPVCALCFFNHYKEEESCTKGKRMWLNEEV